MCRRPTPTRRASKRRLPLASYPAAAQAKETGGGHPDEVRRHSLNPWLKPGIDERRARGVVRAGAGSGASPRYRSRARLRIDLVGLHGDLVVGVRDTSTQVFIKNGGVPR